MSFDTFDTYFIHIFQGKDKRKETGWRLWDINICVLPDERAILQLKSISSNFLHAADTNEDWFVCLAALYSWSLITQSVLCTDWYVLGSLRVLNR